MIVQLSCLVISESVAAHTCSASGENSDIGRHYARVGSIGVACREELKLAVDCRHGLRNCSVCTRGEGRYPVLTGSGSESHRRIVWLAQLAKRAVSYAGSEGPIPAVS